MQLNYPWLRFWVPHDGAIDLSDAGFLRDPRDWQLPRALAPLAGLQNWRALALLGEPGIGKSSSCSSSRYCTRSTSGSASAKRQSLKPLNRTLGSLSFPVRRS